MVRSSKKTRRLVVGDVTLLWSLLHEHEVDRGGFRHCREVLDIRRIGSPGRLLIEFGAGNDRFVADGCVPSGTVSTADGRHLNLHEPGTVRALLDASMADGWDLSSPSPKRIDGWTLFDTVAVQRGVLPG